MDQKALQKIGSRLFLPLGRKVRTVKEVRVGQYTLSAGMEGRVDEGQAPHIIDYAVECPVQFDKEGLPKTIGVPWPLLEFADLH